MEIFFYIIIFIMGITFGSFYTLAVYRIPKGQDIVHTHSYCPKCNHKLNLLDLIPVFSYVFLKGKCRYCKQKIRPRYLILELISGLFFVILAYLLNLSIYSLNTIKIANAIFLVLYFTFIVLIAGIEKETNKINKPVLMYGIIISIIYIIYLYIMGETSIYRYVIYLVCFFLLLIINTIILKKRAKDNYITSILIILIIMSIFTGEYITICTIIITLLAIVITILLKKLTERKNTKTDNNSLNINTSLYLGISNIIYLFILLITIRLI